MNSTGIVYAFALGLVATVNPCGFPLLPAYLAVFLGPAEDALPLRLLRALKASVAMTAGFVAVFAVFGLAAAAGIRLGLSWVPVFTAVLGLALLVVGVFGVAGRALPFPALTIPFRSGRGLVGMAGYGAAFAMTSLGCALPLFLAAVAPTSTDSSPFGTVAAALAYALGMGLVVAACSVLAAAVSAESVRVIGRWARFLPRLASILLLLVGVYLLAYGTRLALQPGTEPALGASVARLSAGITAAVSAHPLLVGAGAIAVVLATMIAVAVTLRRTRPHDTEQQ